MTLRPELAVPCPTCKAAAHQPCISRRAVSLHQSRRAALQALETQADQILAGVTLEPSAKKTYPRRKKRKRLSPADRRLPAHDH